MDPISPVTVIRITLLILVTQVTRIGIGLTTGIHGRGHFTGRFLLAFTLSIFIFTSMIMAIRTDTALLMDIPAHGGRAMERGRPTTTGAGGPTIMEAGHLITMQPRRPIAQPGRLSEAPV